MAATREDIKRWLGDAKVRGAVYMLVVCDSFDYTDYPRSVMPGQSAIEVARDEYGYPGQKDMQRVMECYYLLYDIEEQLNQPRSLFFDEPEGAEVST